MAQSKETHQGQIEGVVPGGPDPFWGRFCLQIDPSPSPSHWILPPTHSVRVSYCWPYSACLCEGQDHSTLGCQNKEEKITASKQGENHKKQGEDHSKQDGYEDHSKQGEDHSKQREGKEDRESG